MYRSRLIPCLLLQNTGFVKTVKFKEPKYLGDPINILKLFNDKEVDEAIILDITATTENKRPQFALIEKFASECFMPLGYGGGIHNIEDMKTLFQLGIEKVALNTAACENLALVRQAADIFGSQSVVVSIDVKKNWFGKYEVLTRSGRKRTGIEPISYAKRMQSAGAGELFLNSIDRDGTMQGYDLPLIQQVAAAVNIPVVACGGAGNLSDFARAVQQAGASAAAAGSFFVYKGPHRAVLISYPDQAVLSTYFRD